jgi:TatD DNase family protein
MRLVDSHAHLQSDAFDQDALEVLWLARHEGVERMLVPGWDVASSRASVAFVAGEAGLLGSAGAHPHVAAQIDGAAWDELTALAGDPRVAAIGETGLDYDRAFAPREDQLANLRRHIALALELGKPLILHCRSKPRQRDAQDDLIRLLSEGGLGGPAATAAFCGRPPAVLHSFSGPVDYGERALDLGCAVSFSGLVFRRGEEASVEVARLFPADSLLIETDSPYLSPPGAPRRRNEPRYVAVTAQWLAEQRGEDAGALGDQLVANFDRIFPGAAPPA